MSPAHIEEMAVTAAPESRKRPSPSDDNEPATKRQRTSSSHTILPPALEAKEAPKQAFPSPTPSPTPDVLAKEGLRRSIALVLDKLGFDSADSNAMQSFVVLAETYLESMVEEVKVFANSARRSYPIPTDYEHALKRFNLTTESLNPHRKPPIPRSKREPQFKPLDLDNDQDLNMPILDEELNGAVDKNAKPFIPASFPSFPSIHTYKYTPETVEAVTVSEDWGAYSPDTVSQTVAAQSQTQLQPSRPLAPDEIPRGDPKKIREAAAKEAKFGEEALRRLMRASKIAKQKEVWSTAQQEPERKERYDLWEAAMRELIEEDQKAKGNTLAPAAVHGAMGRFEIADHSMIVNSESRYARKDMQRAGGAAARKAAGETVVGKG